MIIDVLALGESIKDYDNNSKNIRIGVNDTNKFFPCHHLVVINSISGFLPERRRYIKGTDSHVHTIENLEHETKTNVNLVSSYKMIYIKKKGKEIDIDNDFYHSRTSPFVAVHLAFKMGAKIIRCFGVDLQTHHAYSNGKPYREEMECWKLLIDELKKKDVKVQFTEYSKLNTI